ncbi:Alanyl-tRNA editing protein Aarsd1-A [Armadillidium vulgare]|nr:Alanyl-tRNA editing protein Aarsd1-A [Armadillidium vulgare]
MVFYCQRNCYGKKYSTSVLSCTPTKIAEEINGKKSSVDCYEVIFKDTVFFPEGGGQPYDKGEVNGIPVLKVLRKGGNAVHYLSEPVEVGSNVDQVIDWNRRHDHMQQHSAQHLITELEENVNEAIRNCTPVLIEEFDTSDPKLQEARTRGLPDDIVGPVRVVTIKDLDSTMCCGTHVKNLSDLQAIKILYCEKGKKGKTILYFVAGKRVLNYLKDCVGREKELNLLLHSNPSDHIRLVEKTKKELKQYMKSLNEALRDLATAEAFRFNQQSPKSKIYFHHRRDGDLEYLGALVSAIDDENVLKILTAGEDSGPGVLIIHGKPEDVSKVSKKVCEILEGKGGGKTRFTAKIQKPHKRKEVEEYVTQIFGS